MSSNLRKFSLCAVTLVLLAGCAADPRLGPDGKSGYVTEFYSIDKLLNAPPHCLSMLTRSQIETFKYVEIQVQNGRGRRYISALVPPSIHPALHDKVEVVPSSCKGGEVPVVRQILSENVMQPDRSAISRAA